MVNHVLNDWLVYRESDLLDGDLYPEVGTPKVVTQFVEAVRALGLSPEAWLLGVGTVPFRSPNLWRAGFQFDGSRMDPRAPNLGCLQISYYPHGTGSNVVPAMLDCMAKFLENLRFDYVALHRERMLLEKRLGSIQHILPYLQKVPGCDDPASFPGYMDAED